ncbi:serine hydrolase [Erythrobacter neustonensis]|uniref:Beta-lactamase class A catalytic domain-containing protein n=1 Tax=Erythrobacter neustonensis TaxID=1112 RepID=A0A192D697_9SPHN|nr:serine hydrolase [Erythrobacter neustonensis]ANK13556.1 hypothetical protein A9D12_12100 [Erythrobacter neustonensis]
MIRNAIFGIALAAGMLAPLPLAAQQTETAAPPAARSALAARADQVVALINGALQPEDIFTDAFRAAVADAQIRTLSANLTAQFGKAVEVSLLNPAEGTRAALEIRFERGLAKGGIAIDPAQEGRINELRFTSFDAVAVAGDTPAAILADLAALPGTTNAWFGPVGGAPVLARNADTRLALGSTFKLYVLAALAEDVKAGRRKWSDVAALSQNSYPSGQLQNWPQGAPVTLHTLAGLMISISDNTATDQLIAVLGRARILKLMADSGHSDPAANTPFLTTRELFVMKAGSREDIASWRKSDAARRAAMLGRLASQTTSLDAVNAAFAGGPKAIDIEWFASPADLAKLIAHMRKTADPKAFEIMAISPSATDTIKGKWPYIGFKGGSEPGVLNLTWALRDAAGQDWLLTLGWNNDAAVVDQGKLEAIAQRILLLPR